MLKLSLKEGEYVNIGDNIRVVYAGGSGKNGRLMIDAPREMNISRSNNDPNPEKRKDTYYPEPKISDEAQHEIKKIIWNERQKKAKSAKSETGKKA
ncbi:MAG: carbon storage regulator [Agathobacter rectalis]